MSEALPLPAWPDGAAVAVSLTFDVDAEAGWLGEGPEFANRLSTLSEGRFGVVRGLPRLLALLAEEEVAATFYVPGETAERHPAAIEEIAAAGHEIGHHGHRHLRSDGLSAEAQRRELAGGTAALESLLGAAPRGYRSPSWELTPETFALLVELGFDYDSSCMGDDRPYLEEHEGARLLELPVHWSLDDWPHFAWNPPDGGLLHSPAAVLEIWLAEFDRALAERGHVTYTMHPEVIGRGYRLPMLREMVRQMRSRGEVWFARHGAVAAAVRP